MFSQVSVCPRGGGCLPHCMLGYNPPWQTPTPAGQTPPGQTAPQADTPLLSACWDTVNKWVVCIPLECILVYCIIDFLNTRLSFGYPLWAASFNSFECCIEIIHLLTMSFSLIICVPQEINIMRWISVRRSYGVSLEFSTLNDKRFLV